MDDEDEILEHIEAEWARTVIPPSARLIALIGSAVQDYPSSSEIWLLYGKLLQIWDDNPNYSVEENIEVFRRVIELDSGCWEAYQECGYLYDVFRDDFESAEAAFRTAIALGAEENSYYGLARSLAQMGRKSDALDSLSPEECPYSQLPDIVKLRDEILDDVWTLQ